MSDNTHIQWSDATWNIITGCSVVSPGCTNCYAMRLAGGRLRHHPSRVDLTDPSRAGPVWNGKVRFNSHWLDQPLRWKKPRRIFVCAHGDLFHENVPDEWIDRVFGIMALAPQHQFQVLTKRAERMHKYLDPFHQRRADSLGRYVRLLGYDGPFECLPQFPFPNVWLGVSCEDQQRADERIPLLLDMPAAVRFVSAEPLLGSIEFESEWLDGECAPRDYGGAMMEQHTEEHVNWIIVGGESGKDARPMDVEWARSIVKQCKTAGVPCFVKQLGARPRGWCAQNLLFEHDGSALTNLQDPFECDLVEASEGPYCGSRCHFLRDPKGGDPSEWPHDLRVREMPG